ncbi:MAG: hypothetical protein EBX09_08360, partial [Actinobacteria bacterium]|nr:hypothetical protein [Actinomycetota bacterium]
ITCSGGVANNYRFVYGTGTLTVNKSPLLTITTANLSVNRGASITPTYSASGLGAGVIGSIAYTYTGTGSTNYPANKSAPTAVGSYSITIADPASDITFTTGVLSNYNSTSFPAATLTISIASLSVTANSHTITFGSAVPTAGYSLSGLAAGDTITAITYTYAGSGSTSYPASTTPPTNAGTYTITPSDVTVSRSGVSVNNSYDIAYSTGTLTINKATAIVTPTSTTVEYGSSPTFPIRITTGSPEAELPIASITGYSAPTCSANSYSVTSDSSTTHTISCTGGSSTNYNFTTTATATLTVIQAPLNVTVEAKSLSYGAAVPASTFYTYVISGYKNSQNSS